MLSPAHRRATQNCYQPSSMVVVPVTPQTLDLCQADCDAQTVVVRLFRQDGTFS
jgi:hypothetical protein